MATRTETIYHHICDLCGKEREEEHLARLWGPNPRAGQRPQIDTCPDCQLKPVSQVLVWFTQQAESGPRATLKASRPAKGAH
jgi:hypothetical protein